MYIDLFIIQNLIYDYLILNGVAILTDEKMRLSRLSLGLISSLVLSTLLFMMDFTTLVGLVPFVMLAIVFSKQNIKCFMTKVLYFYCLSLILSGAIYTISHFIKFDLTIIPYILILLVLAFIVTLIYVLKVRWLNDQQLINQFIYDVRIFCGPIVIKGSGFVDTGNHLIDEKTALPIMMVPKEMFCKESMEDFLMKHRISSWSTSYSVINDDQQYLLVFKPTLLLINDQVVRNVLIGVVENQFYEYDFLLQPSMVRSI